METNELVAKATELGRINYRAYGEVVGFKNYQGLPMPAWEELTPSVTSAWIHAAIAVAKRVAED